MFYIYCVLQKPRVLTLEHFPATQLVDTKKFLHPSEPQTPTNPAFDLRINRSKDATDSVPDWYVLIRCSVECMLMRNRDCQIMSHPANIDELSNHQIQEHEFVLLVRRPGALEYRNRRLRGSDHPVKTYGDRSAADQVFNEDEN